jgi:hypothetical protein
MFHNFFCDSARLQVAARSTERKLLPLVYEQLTYQTNFARWWLGDSITQFTLVLLTCYYKYKGKSYHTN